MLRSAISAFTRVFRRAMSSRRGALLIRGPWLRQWVPALRRIVKNAAPRPGHEQNVLPLLDRRFPVSFYMICVMPYRTGVCMTDHAVHDAFDGGGARRLGAVSCGGR